jgi:hypothetical protein
MGCTSVGTREQREHTVKGGISVTSHGALALLLTRELSPLAKFSGVRLMSTKVPTLPDTLRGGSVAVLMVRPHLIIGRPSSYDKLGLSALVSPPF